MRLKITLLSTATALCLGVTCTIVGPTGTWPPPLDRTDAEISIGQAADGVSADITATITDSFGLTFRLDPDQAVLVNGTALRGPNRDGEYTASISAAAGYTVTVREPTRGVQDTTITAPQFDITSPPAGGRVSLSGFTLTWSNADQSLRVVIELTQTLAGMRKTETLGPLPDTGRYDLTDDDLREFVQGADLVIAVTKRRAVDSVAGFRSARLSACVWSIRTTTPGP